MFFFQFHLLVGVYTFVTFFFFFKEWPLFVAEIVILANVQEKLLSYFGHLNCVMEPDFDIITPSPLTFEGHTA